MQTRTQVNDCDGHCDTGEEQDEEIGSRSSRRQVGAAGVVRGAAVVGAAGIVGVGVGLGAAGAGAAGSAAVMMRITQRWR